MRSVISNNKGQYFTLPMILLFAILFFILYVVMVYPSERAKLLGVNETTAIAGFDFPGATVLFSSGEITEVGRSTGKTLFSFDFGNAQTSFLPAATDLQFLADFQLISSVVSSGSKRFDINGLDVNKTDDILVTIKTGAISGQPKISLVLNGSTIFEKYAEANSEYKVRVQQSLLDKDNILYLKVSHTGWAFWTTHNVDFKEILITQNYFVSPSRDVKDLNLGESTFVGDNVLLTFKVDSADTSGALKVLVKSAADGKVRSIWSGKPSVGDNIAVNFDYRDLGLGLNQIVFEADKRGNYALSNVNVSLISEPSPINKKVYSFDLSKDDIRTAGKSIVFGVRVERVISPGWLGLKVLPSTVTQYFDGTATSSAWSFATLDKSDLVELGNKVEVSSANGMFKINGAVVLLK